MKYALGVALVVLLVIAGCGGCAYKTWGTKTTETITVKSKERVENSSGNGAKYLVYTEDEVFENTDAWLNGKTGSSDLYNLLEEGQTYECEINGWRVSLLSWYRNLLSCEAV